MDAGYCLYVHIFMKNIKSLKPFNFYNSNQLMPDLRFIRFQNTLSTISFATDKQSNGQTNR